MEVRRYLPSDKDMLDLWWNAHNMPPISGASLPSIGYIVGNVGAGFLYRTDSDIALIENYITNPNSSYIERSDALDAISAALIDEAKELGIKIIMVLTTAQAIANRAYKFGFRPIGSFHVMRLDMRERLG